MIDPVKFKKIIVTVIKILVVIEVLGALAEGLGQKQWGRFGFDILIAGILYLLWDRIRLIIRDKKEVYKRKVVSSDRLRLWDALVFSLLWSDEIYGGVPVDRQRLIITSYTLIALGLLAAFMDIGSGLMPLVISGIIVLGAVNLLVWVVSLERTEKEALQTELKLARDVQMSLMPKHPPQVPGFDVAGISIPAQQVGGDLYNFAPEDVDQARLGIFVFDVSGKGMQAAMTAVFTCGSFATQIVQTQSPAEVLSRLNTAVYDHTKRGQFVAFFFGVVDAKRREFTFANAGQTKPLLKSSGKTQWLDGSGVHFPLGMTDNSRYEELTVPLQQGDVLFLLTDGISEAMNAKRELYGEERIERFVCSLDTSGKSAAELVEAVTSEVRAHLADAPQNDDLTLVVVKVI